MADTNMKKKSEVEMMNCKKIAADYLVKKEGGLSYKNMLVENYIEVIVVWSSNNVSGGDH